MECPRRYWFQECGSWVGWDAGADARAHEIYIPKQLKTRLVWAGERVHTPIERTLENLATSVRPQAFEVDEIVRITLEEMRLDFKSSRSKQYLLFE